MQERERKRDRGVGRWEKGHVMMTEAAVGDVFKMEKGAASQGVQVATRS